MMPSTFNMVAISCRVRMAITNIMAGRISVLKNLNHELRCCWKLSVSAKGNIMKNAAINSNKTLTYLSFRNLLLPNITSRMAAISNTPMIPVLRLVSRKGVRRTHSGTRIRVTSRQQQPHEVRLYAKKNVMARKANQIYCMKDYVGKYLSAAKFFKT